MTPIPTLLLTGANNHDWRRSAPFLRDLLEQSGRFAVTVTEHPSEALEDAAALARYRLLFSDYNGPDWSPAAQANFVAALHEGAGLVAVHAANNAFAGWVEYERMLGVLWREGAGHGDYHEFLVAIRDHDHPVTRGLEDFRLWDELYHNLAPTPGAEYHVLATAWSDPGHGGTGRDEPMMVVTQYGQGRVFHQILGHVWEGGPLRTLENPGFQASLLRGCLWAATGEAD